MSTHSVLRANYYSFVQFSPSESKKSKKYRTESPELENDDTQGPDGKYYVISSTISVQISYYEAK